MSLTAKDIEILSAPFDEKTIGVKVQSFSKDKTKAMLICYLQHTDVYARLEQVDPAWSVIVTDEKQMGEWFVVRVRMTIKGVSRENTGEGDTPKSAVSDAFKRAAMLFGVGRYLYDSEQVWVAYDDQRDRFRVWEYADYRKALRPSQAPLPVAKAGTAGPITPKADAPATGPKTIGQLSTEIMKVGQAMGLGTEQIAEWAYDIFKKPSKNLTRDELQKFLDTMMHEAGRNGVAV